MLDKIVLFGLQNQDLDSESFSKDVLGGKGYGLLNMEKVGINIPSGFVIKTKECNNYKENNKISNELLDEIKKGVKSLEDYTSKSFGGLEKGKLPLLLSVRSGAPVSMPGMMDTVLNVGLNDEVVEILKIKMNNGVFAYDSYRRFIEMYSDVVLSVDHSSLTDVFYQNFNNKEINNLNEEELKKLIKLYKEKLKNLGHEFPQDPKLQLLKSIEKVFASWSNQRAVKYREIYNIDDKTGTAVVVQIMVFGNLNENSGTGVLFSRDPANGDNVVVGEYLPKAQGEDIVSGSFNPFPIFKLKELLPEVYDELLLTAKKLEKVNKEVQDIEFTVEDKRLWILQTRTAKRTTIAGVKILHDLFQEGLISFEDCLRKIETKTLGELFHGSFKKISEKDKKYFPKIGNGLPASTGCASGIVVLDSETAEIKVKEGFKVILVRKETNPEDVNGMHLSEGILTANGGMTSHAAVIARGFGKPCVCGCNDLNIDYSTRTIAVNGHQISEFDYISINGSNGDIIKGEVPIIKEDKALKEFLFLLNKSSSILDTTKVRVNAETVLDLSKGLEFLASGVGLVRTEHMFFEKRRLLLVRKMIINKGKIDANEYNQILSYHKEDFFNLFKLSDDKNKIPYNIRLLDPPLHEFLPASKYEIKKFSRDASIDYDLLKNKIDSLKELNPMTGCRGIRLGLTFPEIYNMQIKAIFLAYVDYFKKFNTNPEIEIMMPLIVNEKEVLIMKQRIIDEKLKIEEEFSIKIKCKIGVMIETPSACMNIQSIAKHIDYISFGTNDLTQTAFALSRDDYGKFIESYTNLNIFDKDPFVTLATSVKALIKIAIDGAKKVNKDIYWSMCGEHAGDSESIDFAIENNFKYLSCSPYRVPSVILNLAKKILDK